MSSNLFGTVLAMAAGLACCVAIATGAVVCWRWLRPNGQLQPRRYAVVSYTLAALFSALAVAGMFEKAWPTAGLSTALAAAFAASVRRMQRRSQDSPDPDTAP